MLRSWGVQIPRQQTAQPIFLSCETYVPWPSYPQPLHPDSRFGLGVWFLGKGLFAWCPAVLKLWAQEIFLSHLPLVRIPYCFHSLLVWSQGLIYNPGWPPSGYVVEDDLGFKIILPLPLQCCDYRHALQYPVFVVLRAKPRALSVYRKHSTKGASPSPYQVWSCLLDLGLCFKIRVYI